MKREPRKWAEDYGLRTEMDVLCAQLQQQCAMTGWGALRASLLLAILVALLVK